MDDLRDLEADRRLLTDPIVFRSELTVALAAALDEIDRLKRLLVHRCCPDCDEWLVVGVSGSYPTKADAWAEVRKAAMR